MRLLYTAFLIILSAPLLFSQEIEFAPFQGNPVLRSHFSKTNKEKQAYIQRHFGLDINEENGERDGLNGCPPTLPIGINIVESGKTIAIEIDTFGLAVDSTPPIMTLLFDPPLLFGSAAYLDSIITVNYTANPGLLGAGIDTVRIHYVQGDVIDTVLKIAINIRRKDRTVLADAASVPAGGVLDYCLDDEFDFPYSRKCFRFDDCFANYDGDGYQFKYFRNDSCFVYLASRFPGTDTVCVEICDSIGICDIFKIPIHIIGDTLSIAANPFFEDFSTSDGPYPSNKRWLEDDVYVNNTFAKNPPSVGMATFDGLNSGGKPYELPGGGTGDQLTSKAIDLSSFNANSNVYLRFFVAPKGFGQEPEDDDFIVEFRDKQRKWVEVMTIDGTGNIPLDSLPPFSFYAIKIEDAKFFHDAFQMRFRADSSPGGYGDWWHLDYIHLDNFSTDINNFSDFAFSTPPETFLKNYTAIPLRHLQADLDDEIKSTDVDPYSVTVSNRSNSETYVFQNSKVKYQNKTSGSAVGSTFTVANANESQTDPLSFKTIDVSIPASNRIDLINDLNGLSGTDPICIETEFSFEGVDAEEANFKTNDTVRLNTVFSDYFSHDDGTAELQFFWGNANGGEEAAVQYKTNVDDSLKGIRIMFPHYTFYDIENQVFNLKVWFGHPDSIGPVGDAVYEQEFMQPYFADEQFDTLQGFTTYVLEDILENEASLFIPANTIFYVGFEQLTSAPRGIPVGFDINNECGCNFRKKTSAIGWKPFSSNDPGGAMMIRPVFGSVQNTWNGTNDLADDPSIIQVFPNPASDHLNIRLEKGEMNDFKYMVFNQLGQMMQKGDLSPTIALHGFIDGTYYLQAIKKETGETWINRFIVTNNR